MTVLGAVPADQLGVVLPHEHVLCDISYKWAPPADPGLRPIAEEPVQMQHLGLLRRHIGLLRDNLCLTSLDLAIEEVAAFKRAGGGTIVDCSVEGIGRDPLGLRSVSAATGVHIVAPCGWYLARSHPPQVAQLSEQELAAVLIRELTQGIGDTGVRAGIIGEIGVGQPMYGQSFVGLDASGARDGIDPAEEKVLRAAARAQAETRAPISVHIWNYGPNRLALRALEVLQQAGADLERVIICHLDTRTDLEYVLAVLDRGAYAEFDTFGQEAYLDIGRTQFARDTERVAVVAELVRRGLAERILLAHDICTKTQLRHYGGWGYSHLSEHIEPRLRWAGVSDAAIHTMRVANPARLLAYLD